jgi:hypothetical protein
VFVARDHQDFEGRRHQRERQEYADERQVARDVGVGQPRGNGGSGQVQHHETQRPHQRERSQRVAHAAAGLAEAARNEVVQAFGRADLRESVESRVDEEQLLIGAESARVERAGEHDRDRERRGKTRRTASHQQESWTRRSVRSRRRTINDGHLDYGAMS